MVLENTYNLKGQPLDRINTNNYKYHVYTPYIVRMNVCTCNSHIVITQHEIIGAH